MNGKLISVQGEANQSMAYFVAEHVTDWLPGTLGFSCSSVAIESAHNAGSSTPGLGRSPGGGHGNPLQSSCLDNAMDRGAWQAIVLGVAKSRT